MTTMKNVFRFAAAAAVMMTAILYSCQKDVAGNDATNPDQPHPVTIYLTDHQTPVFDSVFIDLQRLDWKQALRVYEQIRTLAPDDDSARKNIIELNLRMAQPDKALSELENYINHLESQNKGELAITFLEELVKDHDDQPLLKRTLAAQLHQMGRTSEAVPLLDVLGEILVERGDREGAIDVINQIVLMNPHNVEDYRQLLKQLRGG